MKSLLYIGIALSCTASVMAGDWTAFSTIEKDKAGKSFKETVILMNSSSRTITLTFPNFQFYGHDDTPAQSIGPMGNVVLKPNEAVRFIHLIPLARKNGFASEMGIQDIQDNIPIQQITVIGTFGG